MDEVPIALGLQIIDAQSLKDGIIRERNYMLGDDGADLIDNAFKLIANGN